MDGPYVSVVSLRLKNAQAERFALYRAVKRAGTSASLKDKRKVRALDAQIEIMEAIKKDFVRIRKSGCEV